MVVDDEEKANILNTFFSTVFTVENEMLGEIPRNNENPILRVTNLTQEEVRNRLNKIKIDKSPGPDGIHPRVLRELSNVIDKPLFLIFRDSIATGSVPQDWRIANVVPIFKKGSKSEPGNYRPLGLIPQIESVSNLCTELELQEYDYYNCIEIATDIGAQILPDVCEKLIFSMSARIHNGALKCKITEALYLSLTECTCDLHGSVRSICSKIGGQCQCKLNVVGSCCDRCAVGSYGFGPNGCQECNCDSKWSISTLCDQVTGQCACRGDIQGQRCDSCLPGYYEFPNCRPCRCNGNSETCDAVTGACKGCKGFTDGTNCERCIDNYYGNPLLGQPCRPCMCPGSPTSKKYFAHSCQQNNKTMEVTCNCFEGYTGKNCDECPDPDGFYGNIERRGRVFTDFFFCQCNDNINSESSDRYAVGSFGFGTNGCQECNCDSKGSISTLCDQVTGQCACRGDIQGQRCDSCLPGYYGFPNCRPCRCNGNSETCDPVTGACKGCKRFTDGTNCERCIDNYYGNPLLGQPCRPCMCPGSPTSKKYFADSCKQNNKTMEVTCNCLEGYTGKNCNECPDGFYGNIEEGEECLSCQCNDNINVKDPNSCDKITGECLLCMKNTYGPNCESCLPGFFGSGLHHNCTKCNCDSKGSISTLCDQVTGQCACRGDIQGQRCDSCLPGYYGFPNCRPCRCNGNSETCDPVTGACKGCKRFTDGTNCERGLNAITIKNKYPLPLISELFDRLRGAKIFTKLDLQGAYNLIRIREGDEWKTAFNTRDGHYEYMVMPFGLCNAPGVFQDFVNDIFRDMLSTSVVVYLDDILIFSPDIDSHRRDVGRVFELLRANSLYAKLEKCVFEQESLPFLGYIISAQGLAMDPAKLQAVMDWQEPHSLKAVQRFMGFINYYRQFIPHFSTLVAPLVSLTKKGANPKLWSEEVSKAFTSIKSHFASAPILHLPDVDKPFLMEVDASSVGAGAVLYQKDAQGRKHSCFFFSKTFC
ncbi:unnamed protein product [Ranitomeya imitator]|uniref:ribonuclease H n=1 Tax=Ranitomeya imitator TaxID=111125 RepID=A0ABN9LK94_9NEOB|nr:unnamed protein product [Ranitomeya imitator]